MGVCRRLCRRIKEAYGRMFSKKLKVLFLGLPKCGKTTLIPAIFEKRFVMQPTAKTHMKKYRAKNVEFTVYDVSGKEGMSGRWDYFYKKCNTLVFVVDSCSSEEEKAAAEGVLNGLFFRNREKKNILVLGSKNDKPKAMDCKSIIFAMNLAKIYDRDIACYSVSAKTLVNTDMVIPWLLEQAEYV